MWRTPAVPRCRRESGGTDQPGGPLTSVVQVTEQCTVTCVNNGNIPNLTYRSGLFRKSFQGVVSWRGSASYVTGRQSLKFGYQAEHQISNGYTYTNDQF